MKYIRVLISLLRTNLFLTVWFNLKMFPLKQAIYCPVYIYGKMIFRSTKGEVVLNTTDLYPGMIKIGKKDYYVETTLPKSIWTINGKIVFNGPINFLQGSYVLVSDNATLSFGTNGTFCGSNTRIMCFDNIAIGNNVHITWDIQLMDTSFHYIEKIGNLNVMKPLTQPICVGDRVWIGNRSTISKGSIIPNDTIIASNSLVNKDFSNLGSCNMLAGNPAVLKIAGVRRIFDTEREKDLDVKYGYSRTHL